MAFVSVEPPETYEDSHTRLEFALKLSQNRRACIPSDGTPSSAFARVQQQRRSGGMDGRDLCLDHRTGDLGTPQCLPKLALGIKN